MKIKKTTILLLLILGVINLLAAQQIEELYSPAFLSGGMSTVSNESPMADILNPAVSGADQRTSIDLSYIGLHNFTAGSEDYGLALNLGMTYPSRIGVFSGSAHFVYSPFTATNLGSLFEADFSFSKDLYSNLLIGAGSQLILGSQSGTPDWGLAASLGFVHIVNDLWIFKDFNWGFAMRGMGKGYDPLDQINWLYPRPFTPALGASFKVLKTDKVSITLSPDLAVPAFQNFQFNLGADIRFFDAVSLKGALVLNTNDMLDSSTSRIPLTFGISGTIPINIKSDIEFLDISERGWNQSDLNVHGVVMAPLHNDVKAIGAGLNMSLGVLDREPPQISVESEDTVYISPNLDGIQDDLLLPLAITDKRYVKGYKLVVTDADGAIVREIQNKDVRPENVSVENVISRLTYVKTGITIPESVRWDGNSDTGTVVPDGIYSYHFEAWDDNGNIGKTEPKTVVVDNTAPSAEIKTADLIFSPNSDGNKDILPIEQTGSSEDLWQGTFSNVAGEVVRTISWTTDAPEAFQWDGQNDEGILVPDGVYNYSVTATDRAGNVNKFQIENIIINTEATPININIGLANFSPNGDGVKDLLRFNLEIPVTSGIENWTLNVVDKNEAPVKTFSGSSDIPLYIDFDGTNDAGDVLPEGAYTGKLKLLYISGTNPDAVSPEFVIDLTPPSAVVKSNVNVFSPNNDGNKDSVVITQDSSDEILWSGKILDRDNLVVKTYSWKGIVDSRLEWDGTDDSGMLVTDGSYTYFIESTDKAGNKGVSDKLAFQLNTEETPVILSMNARYFSPNKDGSLDSLKIVPHLQVTSGVENYKLSIKTASGVEVKTFNGRNSVPQEFIWDGTNNQNKQVEDGEYFAQISMLYRNGNEPSAKTIGFFVDTGYPEITVDTDYTLFSPDDDGNLDTMRFQQLSSNEDLWDGEIINAAGDVVKSFYWKGQAGNFEWNGKDENGNVVDDGSYSYKIVSTDRAGNTTSLTIPAFGIDTRQTSAYLTVQSNGFSPNIDGVADSITFKPYVSLNEGITKWTVEMMHKNAGVQKTFSGNDALTTDLVWDGLNDEGQPAAEGYYTAELKVEYLKGNKPSGRTNEFRLDVSAPEINLAISPEYFSPDNDNLNDELIIRPAVTDLGPIEQWDIEILDPKGKHFTSFQGKGTPTEQIIWNGISDTGELVQSAEDYSLNLTVRDDLGNVAATSRKIPIDILVIRDGNRYKIKIASITFAPNTADYLKVDADKLERNLKTIERLAEIFKKYDKYKILIEGHAVSLFWNDPVRGQKEQMEELIPLSKERADSIKRALVEFGLDPNRISTEGIGGSQPVVPHGDIENRWKNRRVEFILIRE